MKKGNSLIMQKQIFAWLAAGTGLILLLPFFAMQFHWQIPDPGSSVSQSVNWTRSDFVVMGTLLFGTGSAFVLVARKIKQKYWLWAGIAFAFALLWLWAELAVGVFTNWGS